MLEKIVSLLPIIGWALTLIITIITIVVKSIKNGKVMKVNESLQLYETIKKKMVEYVVEAEKTFTKDKLGESAGAFKKNDVMQKLYRFATTLGYSFNEEEWSDEVDNFVAATKSINVDCQEKASEIKQKGVEIKR